MLPNNNERGCPVSIAYREQECFLNIDTNCFTLCLITQGYAVLLIDNERCYIGKNTAICLAPKRSVVLLASHNLKASSVTFSPAFINVNLNYDFIQSREYPLICRKVGYPDFSLFLNQSSIYNGVLPLEEDDAVSVRKWFTDIIGYLSQQSDKKWSCRVRLILFKIFQLLELQQKFLMDDMKCVDGLVLAILAHISDNIAEEITIESICNKFHIGRNTLNRRFKMAINQTVINYVIGCRIDLAKRSLAFTDLTVDEISRETGFHEHTYFTRMFRMREGITPLEYRKIMRAMRPSVRKTKS